MLPTKAIAAFVPAQVRDAKGHWIEARSLLDTPITIPLAKRTPAWHFHEIRAAVTASTGIELQDNGPNLNGDFAPPGVQFNQFYATTEDVEKTFVSRNLEQDFTSYNAVQVS